MPGIYQTATEFTMRHSHHSSVLSTLLPGVVHVCLTRIPSFLGSSLSLGLANKTKDVNLCTRNSYHQRKSLKDMETPEMEFRALIYSDLRDKTEISEYYNEALSEEDMIGKVQRSVQIEMPETQSGKISWKFANQGLGLLNIAVSEISVSKTKNVPFIRQLYVHSLTYLIRALPTDLTTDEQLSIRAALPDCIAGSPSPQPSNLSTKERSTSFLHRTLAFTIVKLFIFFQFLLPFVQLLLAKAWAYEKEHHIIVKMTTKGVGFGMCVGEAMKGMGEGRMGEIFTGAVQWTLESIIGGIGEGLVIVGALRRKDAGELVTT